LVGPTVGAQFHGMWASYTDVERVAVLDTLRGAGIRTVRLDVSWAMLQPCAATAYDPWGVGFVDRVIDLCAARGITPLVTLWLTPGWANGHRGERVRPDDPADYARVAHWAARRYAGRVVGWEVWNEPNSGDFLVGADAADYARLLRAAYPAVRAGDPDTTLVFGGVQYNDDGWIAQAYRAGAGGSFDVMATHPYPAIADGPPDAPDDGTIWVLNHAAAVHRLMTAHGDGDKPIWFTELGWSTHPNAAGTPNHALGVSEATQARYFTDAIRLIATTMPYVTSVYWYAERDTPAHDIVHNQNFGLLRADHSAKPILAALKAVTTPAGRGPDPQAGVQRQSRTSGMSSRWART
jgi:polysaccharide biosynthesis protein PslG